VARRPERVGTDDGPSLRERNCVVNDTAPNGRVKVANTQPLSLAPIIRRPYRNLTEAIYWMHKEWPDWEVRRDETAKMQALGQADDALQAVIAHATHLSQTLRRCYDVEMNRIAP
jgi:hypothetical protein